MQQVLEVRAAARASTSLDAPVGDGEDAVFGDFVAGDEPLPEEAVELNLRSEALRRALAALPEREREVVAMRYGLGGAEPQTLEEIGRRLGLTRERVRQIELESLRRLSGLREMQSVDVRLAPARALASPLTSLQVELERRGDRPQLAQRPCFQLAHALAGDPEVRPHFLERPRANTVEAEALDHDSALARLELGEGLEELGRASAIRGLESPAGRRPCRESGRRRSSHRRRSGSPG